MSVGGSMEQMSVRGRTFGVASDAAVTRKLGGYENENRANGDATVRTVKTRVPWMLGGVVLALDDTRGDHEFLQEIADSLEHVDITATYASGVTYQGVGTITGEIAYDSQASTATVDFGGGGELTQQ